MKNITVSGKRTSVRMELAVWDSIDELSWREEKHIDEICTFIKERKPKGTSMTSAIRTFVLSYFRQSSTEEGHSHSGHGSFINLQRTAAIAFPQSSSGTGFSYKNSRV